MSAAKLMGSGFKNLTNFIKSHGDNFIKKGPKKGGLDPYSDPNKVPYGGAAKAVPKSKAWQKSAENAFSSFKKSDSAELAASNVAKLGEQEVFEFAQRNSLDNYAEAVLERLGNLDLTAEQLAHLSFSDARSVRKWAYIKLTRGGTQAEASTALKSFISGVDINSSAFRHICGAMHKPRMARAVADVIKTSENTVLVYQLGLEFGRRVCQSNHGTFAGLIIDLNGSIPRAAGCCSGLSESFARGNPSVTKVVAGLFENHLELQPIFVREFRHLDHTGVSENGWKVLQAFVKLNERKATDASKSVREIIKERPRRVNGTETYLPQKSNNEAMIY